MATEQLTIRIDADNRASRALRSVRNRLRAVASTVRRVATAAAAAGAAVTAATVALGKLAQRGTKVRNVQRAFARVVGNTSEAVRLLRERTQGLVSDYELMEQMNQAVTLGAARNEEQFAELAETALTLGRALGVDATHALQSLTLGIGRQSRMILDNLGLTVSVKEANEAYAAQLGKTAEQLTEVERREAFRQATMEAARQKVEELGGVTISAGDAFTQLVTQLKNVRDQLAQLVAESPAVQEFFERLTGFATEVVDALSGDRALVMDAFRSLGRLAGLAMVDGIIRGLRLGFKGPTGGVFGQLLEDVGEDLRERIDEELARFRDIARAQRQIAQIRGSEGGGGGGGGPSPAPGGGGGGFSEGIQDLLADPAQIMGRLRAPIARPINRRFETAGRVGDVLNMDEALAKMEELGNAVNTNVAGAMDTAITSLGAMAEAAVRGTEQMEVTVVRSFTSIMQSLTRKDGPLEGLLGGFGGAIFGAVGGILTAALSSGRDRPQPVRMEEYSNRAQQQMRQNTGPETVQVRILDAQGNVRSTVRSIRELEARDSVVRLPDG